MVLSKNVCSATHALEESVMKNDERGHEQIVQLLQKAGLTESERDNIFSLLGTPRKRRHILSRLFSESQSPPNPSSAVQKLLGSIHKRIAHEVAAILS